VIGAFVSAAGVVVGITAAANLMHAGLTTLSHFTSAAARPKPLEQPPSRVEQLLGEGGQLPWALSWQPAWQQLDGYMAGKAAQQWRAVETAVPCADPAAAWCQYKRVGLHSLRLGAVATKDAAVEAVQLAKSAGDWAPQLWRASAAGAASSWRRPYTTAACRCCIRMRPTGSWTVPRRSPVLSVWAR